MAAGRRSRRGWPEIPAPPPPSSASHSHRLPNTVRTMLGLLTFAVLLLTAAVVVLMLWVVALRVDHDQEAQVRQRAIDDTFCDVLAQLPSDSPELNRLRAHLHCISHGLSARP